MAEINLFSKELLKLKKRQKLKQLGLQLTLAAVGVLAVLLIALSGFSLLVARGNQTTAGKIDDLKDEVESLRPIESKQTYLISKINTFDDLLKSQKKHQAIAEAVFSLLPDGTNLKGFQVAEDGLINLTGSVPDYPTLIELIDRIKNSQNISVPLATAKVNSVSLGSGAINFAIDVAIRVN